MTISAFTLTHNCLTAGIPIIESIEAVRDYVDEIVVVDMHSTDGTLRILEKLGCRILQSPWPHLPNPRDTLNHAFELHRECKGDTIIFFEADEVFDDRLLQAIRWEIIAGRNNLAVWRLQLEQNFQRCRWYPIPVHRVFPKGKGSYVQHPTNCCPDETYTLPPSAGFLWDCSNNFRDNWFGRKQAQSELWGEPRFLMVPGHFTEPVETSRVEEEFRLNEAHFQWTGTPFNIPGILKPLVGVTNYAHSRGVKILLESAR
jgi:glycosyltransferase involved in cell wall biosynthesis